MNVRISSDHVDHGRQNMRIRWPRTVHTRALLIASFCVIAVISTYVIGGATKPSSVAAKPWSQGRSRPLKVTDTLILSIPLEYERTAMASRAEDLRDKPIEHATASFDFFLPDFSGYTIKRVDENFDPDVVQVAYLIASDPHPDGGTIPNFYPPQMLKNILKHLADGNTFKDVYGLRCYKGKVIYDYCYGKRDEQGEYILFDLAVPPFMAGVVNPQLRARYFSKRFGGVEISWRTNTKNFSRWREIDTQIWKFIDAWNIAPSIAERP